MFCQKCGTKNPDNGKFCRNCGTELSAISVLPDSEITQPEYLVDSKKRIKQNDPDELWSAGLKNTILGVGFLILINVRPLKHFARG